jgi:glycosyltransferase involved in cell wall biosynthesis
MNVAYCIFSSRIHGAEKRVIKLALSDNLIKRQYLNYFLVINSSLLNAALEDSELQKLLIDNKSRIITISDSPNSFLWRVTVLFRLLVIKARYKIGIFHSYLNARNIAMLLSFFNIKVIYEITSPDVADLFIKKYNRRRYLYKHLFRINCVSESVYLRVSSGIPDPEIKKQICYISKPYVHINVLDEINVDEKQNTIIYASRFIARKNVLLFARISKRIIKDFPLWNIKIFGSGPLEEEMRGLLKDELISGRAYIGYTGNIVDEFKASKIVCSFIEPDNYPSQSIFEAMAMGNVLLVSNHGNSSIFVGNENGILSDFYEDDLRRLLLTENKVLNKMGLNSISYFDMAFKADFYFKELIDLYSKQ